jgi:hypothetical protein
VHVKDVGVMRIDYRSIRVKISRPLIRDYSKNAKTIRVRRGNKRGSFGMKNCKEIEENGGERDEQRFY